MIAPLDPPFPDETLIPRWAMPPAWLLVVGYSVVAYRAPRSREMFWDYLNECVWQAGPVRGLRRGHKRAILGFRQIDGLPTCPTCGTKAHRIEKKKEGDNVLSFNANRPSPRIPPAGPKTK